MTHKQWNEIRNDAGRHVMSVSKVVAVFEIVVDGGPPSGVTVTVTENADGEFWAHSDYAFWGPEQHLPYRSLRACTSIEEALSDAIHTWDAYMKPEHDPELTFWVYDDIRGQVYIDGNGDVFTKHDAYAKRGMSVS